MSHYVKTNGGYDVKVPSMGQVNYNTVAGSLGILGLLNNNGGLLGNLLGGNRPIDAGSIPVTRYDMEQENRILNLQTENSLLKSNIYTDSKITEAYKELNGKITGLEAIVAQQAVQNQAFKDAFREVQKDIDYKVNLEAERRACADNKIVCYVNTTFAPKLIADYTAGTTTTLANTFNPLCDCCNS